MLVLHHFFPIACKGAHLYSVTQVNKCNTVCQTHCFLQQRTKLMFIIVSYYMTSISYQDC